MATLWDIITANSTLAVQPGNTFWDHLNAQAGGTGVIFINGFNVIVESPQVSVEVENNQIIVEVESSLGVIVEDSSVKVSVEDEINVSISNEINVKIGCE